MTLRHPPVSPRHFRRKLLAGSASLAVVFSMFAFASGAHAERTAPDGNLDQGGLALDDRIDVSLDSAHITDPREEIDLFVQMNEEPVSEFVAQQVQRGRGEPPAHAQRAQAQRVAQQHDEIRGRLAEIGAQEQASMRVGANGLRIRAQVQDIPALAELPGVVSVAPVTLHEPANDTSVPWINTPQAWDFLDDTGEGVTISVIDTGIDYTHASFGGSGDVADYDFILEDTTVIPEVDGEPVFPTPKVVRGFDFAGPNYDASGEIAPPVPQPDPNPIDEIGRAHV